jgi:Flp pilus assembly protein TadG
VNAIVSLLRRLLGEQSGTAAVEAAVALPVLLVLASGVFEISNAVFDHQEIATGVRDAARYLARVTDPTNATSQTYAKNLAVNGVITGGTARVRGWKVGNVTITITAVANAPGANGEPPYRGPNPLNIVTVSTAYLYQQIGLLEAFGLPSPTLNVVHSERAIGD